MSLDFILEEGLKLIPKENQKQIIKKLAIIGLDLRFHDAFKYHISLKVQQDSSGIKCSLAHNSFATSGTNCLQRSEALDAPRQSLLSV